MVHFKKAQWISPEGSKVSEEPSLSLKDMFINNNIGRSSRPEDRLTPPKYLFKEFRVDKGFQNVKMKITSRGLYKTFINGENVTEAIFTPDYTSYNNYLMVQEYDVTHLIEDTNVWTIILSDGWYAGRISVQGGSCQFGDELSVIAEIEIHYNDGSVEIVATNESFIATTGKHVYSDIFIGEKQDFRRTISKNDLPTSNLLKVLKRVFNNSNLLLQQGPQVIEKEFLDAKKIWKEENSWIVDFGQVIAGYTEIETFLGEGEVVSIEHSEVLNQNGLFINNIVGRNKDQKDVYVGRGRKEVLRPDFTFHGFRYIKIIGLNNNLTLEQCHAQVIYSDLIETGSFKCSNKDINQIMNNIKWSQKGNMISIPTDCPQRERVGWTGDTQVFAPTATFFFNMKEFLLRWLDNVVCEQQLNGEILDYTPAPKDFFESIEFTGSLSSAGWGDAIVMVPWELYKKYGDLTILEKYYDSMMKWYEFSKNSAASNKTGYRKYIWDTKFHYGDWMFPSYMMGDDPSGPMATAEATKDLVATAFLANTSLLLAKISELLNKDSSDIYSYHSKVKSAFKKEFINEDGSLTRDFQGCYVLTLAFDLAANRGETVNKLVKQIETNDFKLDTGFLSISYLLDVLCDNGYESVAEKLLFQRDCPSWLYEVDNGATTIWESWAAIQPDGNVTKSSFNHYAFGCIGDWIIRKIGGLQVISPGYKEFKVDPILLNSVEEYEINYLCPYGMISIVKTANEISIVVPKNTKAYLMNTDLVLTEGSYNFKLSDIQRKKE